MTTNNKGSEHSPADSTQKKLGYTSEPAYLTQRNGVNPPLAGANELFVQTFVDNGLQAETAILVRDIFSQAGFVEADGLQLPELTSNHIAFPYNFAPFSESDIEALSSKGYMPSIGNSMSEAESPQVIQFDLNYDGFAKSGEFSCEFTLPQFLTTFSSGKIDQKKLATFKIRLTVREDGDDTEVSYECLDIQVEDKELLKKINPHLTDVESVFAQGTDQQEWKKRLQLKLDARRFTTTSLKEQTKNQNIKLSCGMENISRIMLLDQKTRQSLPTDVLLENGFTAEQLQHTGAYSAPEIDQACLNILTDELSLGFLVATAFPRETSTSHTANHPTATKGHYDWLDDCAGVFGGSFASIDTRPIKKKTEAPEHDSRSRTRSTSRARSPSPATVQRAAALFAAFITFLQRVIDMMAKTEFSHVSTLGATHYAEPGTPPRKNRKTSDSGTHFGPGSAALNRTPCRTTEKQITRSPAARPILVQ